MQQPCSQSSIQKLKYRWECVDKQKKFPGKSVTYVVSGFKTHCMLPLVFFFSQTNKHPPYLGRPLFQFLDPYDGDSEDASIHSDCSLNSLNSVKAAPWASSAPKAMALEDSDTSEDGDSFPKPSDWLCPETKVGGIQTVNDCKAPLEFPSQEKDFPRSLLQSSELTRATEVFTSMWLTPDHSLLMSINPSASADLLASPGNSAPQPILAADCDGRMAKQPLIKRKQGISIPEGASEKLRRKKFRAT